jgi:hypothetical protein
MFQNIIMHSFSGSRSVQLPDPENEANVGNFSPTDTASHSQKLEPSRITWAYWEYRRTDGKGRHRTN